MSVAIVRQMKYDVRKKSPNKRIETDSVNAR
jgi:hypothetical protein